METLIRASRWLPGSLLAVACTGHRIDGAPPNAGVTGAATPQEVSAQIVALGESDFAALLTNPNARPLVVNIWATWCGPCRREMAIFRAAATDHPEVDWALISVDSPRDRGAVERFLSDEDVRLPAYQLETDEPSAVLARNVPGWPDIIPVTLVLSPGGAVQERFDGVLEPEAFRAALR